MIEKPQAYRIKQRNLTESPVWLRYSSLLHPGPYSADASGKTEWLCVVIGILILGAVGEIVWTKWAGHQPPVVVIEPLIGCIPSENVAGTDIRLAADLKGFWEAADLLDK